jgi:hypothetical protein
MQMRFRTDGWHFADYKIAGVTPEQMREWNYDAESIALYVAMPPAEPGDVWRVRWHSAFGDGPIAGYAICCPKCRRVHAWTTATNCSQQRDASWTDKDGVEQKYKTCVHSGVGSCWDWSGSAEGNTLTARPSLLNQAPDCGFHGWLTNGVLSEC